MSAPKLAQYNNGLGSVTGDNLNTMVQSCDTVTQLRGFIGLPGIEVLVRGQTAVNDGNAGAYYWDSNATGADDGINIIQPVGAGASGRWIRIPNSGDSVSFLQIGNGAVSRTMQSKVREMAVSIVDYGGKPGAGFDNTAAFNLALAALAPYGGTIFFPRGLDWHGYFLVNQDNILLSGQGGVGELDADPCLRPFNAASQVAVVQFSNATRFNRKCGLEDIVVSGNDGSGNQCAKTVWIAGGTTNFCARNTDFRDGLHTLHIEPTSGAGFAATGLFFSQYTIRNDVNNGASRAVYVRRYADPDYVTALYMDSGHINATGAGYWAEFDGTGSVGLAVHINQTYVDFVPAWGILFSAAGLESLICFNGLTLDAGAGPVVIIKRQDLLKDPARFIFGVLEGVGGQLIQFSDNSTIAFPDQPGQIMYEPLLQTAFTIGPIYWTNVFAPYDMTLPKQDMAGPNGPLLVYGGVGDGVTDEQFGARSTRGWITQEVTLSTTGTTTSTTSNMLPINSLIQAVTGRVTQTITGATNFEFGDTTTPARFLNPSTGLTAGSTVIGLKQNDGTGAAGPIQTTTSEVQITTTGTPTAGKIRITTFYNQFIAPTS